MKITKLAAAAALMLMPHLAFAHDFKIAGLVVEHPVAYETLPTAKAGGGYLSVTNTGATSDRLIGVRADFPRVELHSSKDVDGLVSMIRINAVEIPAGETVALEPGGKHVMFMGLEGHPFKEGNEIPLTLIFEQAGELDVIINVEARKDYGAKAEGHSGHGASN